MVKLQNLISRIPVPPFQKQPFIDIFQSKCSPVPFEIFTGKTLSSFCLLQIVLTRDLVRLLNLITEKVYQGM